MMRRNHSLATPLLQGGCLVGALLWSGCTSATGPQHAVVETTNGGVQAQVITATGMPAGALTVIARPAAAINAETTRLSTTTDAQGRFVFDSLPPGDWCIEVGDDSLQGLVLRHTVSGPRTMHDMGTHRQSYCGVLHGVLDSAGRDPALSYTAHLTGMDRHAPVGAGGTFSFGRLPPAQYRCVIAATDELRPVVSVDTVSVHTNQVTALQGISLLDGSALQTRNRLRLPEITCWFDEQAPETALQRYSAADHLLLHEVNPLWYRLVPQGALGTDALDGSLYAVASLDPAVVDVVHSHGDIILPAITLAGAEELAALLATPAAGQTCIAACIATARTLDYDGWLFHAPAGSESMRAGFSSFVAMLVDSLHAHGLFLSLSIPALAGPLPEAESHIDLAALRILPVNSYKVLIDPATDTPAPLAAMARMEAILDFLIGSGMEARKIQMVLPTVARRWSARPDGTFRFRDETPFETFSATHTSQSVWDESAQESVVQGEDGEGAWIAFVGDARFLQARLHLFDRYDILGFSLWTLGREDPTVLPSLATFFR